VLFKAMKIPVIAPIESFGIVVLMNFDLQWNYLTSFQVILSYFL
jgi:hypothetical protein